MPGKPVRKLYGKTNCEYVSLNLKPSAFSRNRILPTHSIVKLTENTILMAEPLKNCITQYDLVTSVLTSIIRYNCIYGLINPLPLLPNKEVPANFNVLYSPIKVVVIKSHNYAIVMNGLYHPFHCYSFEKNGWLIGISSI